MPSSCILCPEGCGLLDFLVGPRKVGDDDGSEEGKDDDEGIEEIIRGGHSLSPYGFIITCRRPGCTGACACGSAFIHPQCFHPGQHEQGRCLYLQADARRVGGGHRLPASRRDHVGDA